MSKITYIFSALTIAVSRIVLWTLETNNINKYVYVVGVRWHHLFTGCILVGLCLLWRKPNLLRSILLGIGAGLMIDESFLPLNFYGFASFTYWAPASILVVFFWFAGFLYSAKLTL